MWTIILWQRPLLTIEINPAAITLLSAQLNKIMVDIIGFGILTELIIVNGTKDH